METLSHGDTPFERVDGADAAVEEVALGDVIGRYQIRRLLGAGGMGRVYLARDVTLGRSIALKVVRRDRVGGGGLARFLDEARLIALLNHPHIVQLHDVGEHRGAPYLALEYIEGESLLDRCARERPSVDEALRTLRSVAEALVHAHAAGVIHCDLKPSNVVIARDGRLRVVDFGLARTATSVGSGVAGTPDWMAPEQWLGAAVTDRTDIWALAVMAVQLLVGVHPLGEVRTGRREQALAVDGAVPFSDLTGLSDAARQLVLRSLSRDPAARPAASEWCRVLDEVLEGRDALSVEDGPFRGLAPFDERHARFFFGREAEIDAFVEQLRSTTFLPIAGPSGAGKSSFVFGGIVPRLHARGRWTIIALRPGIDPFDALAQRILDVGTGDVASTTQERRRLANELRATPTLLAARLATLAATMGTQVLLVVDQLEELFTQDATEADVDAFLRLLLVATDDPLEPVRVVCTLRDDFLGRISGLRSLFVLKRLGRDELRRTITGPLARFGYRCDEELLVEEMLSEIGDDADPELPLLQFACRMLWDARDLERRVVTRAAYQRMGGVGGALASHADGVLAALSQGERHTARHLLIRLVVGTARRQVDRERLVEGEAGASAILDRLVAARLVVQRASQDTDAVVVEIAHESLLRTWGQFARWLDESRDERRLIAELEEATSFWERRGHRPEETWSATELVAVRQRLAQLGATVPIKVETFLVAGEARQLRMRRRSRIRWGIITSIGVAVTVLSVVLATEFREQKLSADETNAGLVAANEQLSRASKNLGTVDLIFKPFDGAEGTSPVDPALLPRLSWRLYRAKQDNVHEPGDAFPESMVHAERKASRGERIDRVQAPGGAAFLRIDGRGGDGEACAPSWIRIQALPGYAEGQTMIQTIEIPFPTCGASAAGMVEVPAGPFIYGGFGEQPTRYPNDYAQPERTVTMPPFSIDRTEVSNAAFKPFAQLAPLTGYSVPKYPDSGAVRPAGNPERPVTAIDAFEGEAFCRYMGKRLPSDYEWTKAARGGLEIGGKPNPWPRRLYPWGPHWDARCANIDGTVDGHEWVAPVDSFACGASPYGVLNLAGNVAEWISRIGLTDTQDPLREVRGGAADSPLELEQASTIFRNSREDRQFTFAIGVRCVAGGSVDGGDPWERR
jgi:formylglycine-generating enzyme required for sulfatase activity